MTETDHKKNKSVRPMDAFSTADNSQAPDSVISYYPIPPMTLAGGSGLAAGKFLIGGGGGGFEYGIPNAVVVSEVNAESLECDTRGTCLQRRKGLVTQSLYVPTFDLWLGAVCGHVHAFQSIPHRSKAAGYLKELTTSAHVIFNPEPSETLIRGLQLIPANKSESATMNAVLLVATDRGVIRCFELSKTENGEDVQFNFIQDLEFTTEDEKDILDMRMSSCGGFLAVTQRHKITVTKLSLERDTLRMEQNFATQAIRQRNGPGSGHQMSHMGWDNGELNSKHEEKDEEPENDWGMQQRGHLLKKSKTSAVTILLKPLTSLNSTTGKSKEKILFRQCVFVGSSPKFVHLVACANGGRGPCVLSLYRVNPVDGGEPKLLTQRITHEMPCGVLAVSPNQQLILVGGTSTLQVVRAQDLSIVQQHDDFKLPVTGAHWLSPTTFVSCAGNYAVMVNKLKSSTTSDLLLTILGITLVLLAFALVILHVGPDDFMHLLMNNPRAILDKLLQ